MRSRPGSVALRVAGKLLGPAATLRMQLVDGRGRLGYRPCYLHSELAKLLTICMTATFSEGRKRFAACAAGIDAALLPLGDFRRVPGDGLRSDGNPRWQDACFHFSPDGGARPASGLDHRRQAGKFSRGVHKCSLGFGTADQKTRVCRLCVQSVADR